MRFRVLCSGFLVLWFAVFALRADAQQMRTTRDAVYSAAQAKRGDAVYQDKCVACHGAKLEGDLAPPLSGEAFLGIWGGLPLAELFDKIHNTMPADAPGTLTRPQAIDVVTYVLQANQAPAGAADLAEAALKQVALDSMRGGPSRPAGGAAAGATSNTFPATGTVNQVMRGILFPSSNVLFDVQTQDPGAQGKGGAARADAAATTTRYGNVYEPWQIVDAAAIAIAESGPMLMTPGRRCENGKPAPVDRADWQQYVQGLVDAGRAAYKASQTRNQETVAEVTNVISDACANCHRVYRDVPTNAGRCN
jgi:mono/diheme cytochrome c family protein